MPSKEISTNYIHSKLVIKKYNILIVPFVLKMLKQK